MPSLSEVRAMVPDMQDYAYFQTSGFSPKLQPVTDEVIEWIRYQNQGPALPWVSERMLEVFEATRGRVGKAIHADASEIVLGENATVGINIIAHGIDWKAGDNIILSTHEHPGNRLTWYNLANLTGVELRYVEMTNDEAQLLDHLKQLIDDRTRLISISHVSRRTGLRVPASEIVDMAHAHDVPVLFDGAQSFGAIPLDMKALNCDFYTFSGHKYIMAPQGTGGIYIRSDRIEWLRPSWIGSHSQKAFDADGNMTLLDEAKRFEFGTRNLADQAGFGKALEIWESLGWDTLFESIASYTDQMKEALQSIPDLVLETPLSYNHAAGIVTFHIPDIKAAPMLDSLSEHEHILASTLEFNDESVRVSTHIFNTEEHMDRLITGLKRILRDGL